MGTWRRRPGRGDGTRAREVLDRAVAGLRDCQRNGTTAVPVADMLRLLGVSPETVPVPEKHLDPGADPLTGARWAGPQGSTPPGS